MRLLSLMTSSAFALVAATITIISCSLPTALAFTSSPLSPIKSLSSPYIVATNTFQNGEPSMSKTSTTSKTTSLLASKTNNPLQKLSNTVESTLAILTDLILFLRPPIPIPPNMRRVQTQFIAALGDPSSSSSKQSKTGAEQWGIWRIDPGPRGVFVKDFQTNPTLGLSGSNGSNSVNDRKRMPAGWTLDPQEFWIEEFGRVMEKPEFPLGQGRYVVTGGRETTALLVVDGPDEKGVQGWRLESLDGSGNGNGVTLYDVTHLPCRSAKYCPKRGEEGKRSPADANWRDFPVTPGAEMPAIQGCDKQDYAVLFVLAVDDE